MISSIKKCNNKIINLQSNHLFVQLMQMKSTTPYLIVYYHFFFFFIILEPSNG